MKKQLFTILSALSFGAGFAQTPSPDWTTLQSPSFTIPIAGIRFIDAVDANVVWASGYDGQDPDLAYDFFTRTTNGGATFTSGNVFPDTNTYKMSNLEGIDANTAWVCAYKKASAGGAIFRTTNGGASWQNMTAPGMYTNTSSSFGNWVTFLTPLVGVANGDPVGGEFELWRTIDGGSTWSKVPGSDIPNPNSGEFAIVDMYSSLGPNHVWYGTNQGRVYRSADAGATWSVSTVSSITSFTSSVIEVRFASVTNGLCLIFQNNAYALYNTYDGGATWNLVPGGGNGLPANYGTNEMANVPGTDYYVSAGNLTTPQTYFAGLSYSKDNGLTWTDWGSLNIGYVSIDFADRYHGWAGGFTNVPDNTWPGLFKYSGSVFGPLFTVPQSICMGSSNVTVSPVNTSSSVVSYSFQWSSNPTAQFSSNTASVPVITFTNVGSYTITLAMTDANGTNTLSQVIEVASCSAPVASFTMASQGCQNSIMTLTNTSTGGPAPSVTVTSNPSNNVQIVNVGNNQYSLIFQDPGTYTINMFGSSISGTTSALQVVTINDCRPNVTFNMSSDVACRKGANGLADTVYIHTVNTSTMYPATNYTWAVSPFTGITGFPNITSPTGSVTNPPSKKLALSTSTAAYTYSVYIVRLTVANQYGTTEYFDTLRVTVDNCVGLEEHGGWTSAISLFPNPAHENITVTLPAGGTKPYNVKVVNLLGAVIFEDRANTTGEININLESMKKGVYFVQIENGGTTVTRKFIVD
jgi:photosystem II stability/assembly factor-like uncharacterized protein